MQPHDFEYADTTPEGAKREARVFSSPYRAMSLRVNQRPSHGIRDKRVVNLSLGASAESQRR